MAIFDIFRAVDYVGGVPTAGQVMAVDATGRWTASTLAKVSGSLNATGVNFSTGYGNNLTLSASVNAAGANFSIGYGRNLTLSQYLSVGNLAMWASGASLAFFSAAPVAQQASVSVEKNTYTSVDGNNSATIASALNILAAGINSIGTYLNTFGLTA